jgi:hypothetical protein
MQKLQKTFSEINATCPEEYCNMSQPEISVKDLQSAQIFSSLFFAFFLAPSMFNVDERGREQKKEKNSRLIY